MASKTEKSKVIDKKLIAAQKKATEEAKAAAAEKQERESKIDNEVATRTSRFDPVLKERAKVVGINPDNFAEEIDLGKAVETAEESQGINQLPSNKEESNEEI